MERIGRTMRRRVMAFLRLLQAAVMVALARISVVALRAGLLTIGVFMLVYRVGRRLYRRVRGRPQHDAPEAGRDEAEQPEDADDAGGAGGASGSGARSSRRSPRRRKGAVTLSDVPQEAIPIPDDPLECVERILKVDERNLFAVIGLPITASMDDIKKTFRRLSVKVHPDKNKDPRAVDAFKRLSVAYEILSDEASRSKYVWEVENGTTEEQAEAEMREEMGDILASLIKKRAEMMNTLHCENCEDGHQRVLTDRSPLMARYCNEHSQYHNAKDGDIWAETRYMGYNWQFFACMDGRIYNVTDWAACQRLDRVIVPGEHKPLLRLNTPKKADTARRMREDRELNDLLESLFNPDVDSHHHHHEDEHAAHSPGDAREGPQEEPEEEEMSGR